MLHTKATLLIFALSASLSSAMSLRLKYFDAKGAAEVTRVLLALGDIQYEDERYEIVRDEAGGMSTPGFKADKESGALAANLGRAPVLMVDASAIGQSKAIERYVAAKAGLLGNSELEAAIIDAITEHVRDVKDAASKKGFSAFNRDKSDEEKAAAKAEWFGTDLPSWLQRLEACVAPVCDTICADGKPPTYAAVCIWALLREGSSEDVELATKAAAECPCLSKVADAVASHPKVHAWVESRPVTMF